jgi:hypothetical protein
MMHGKSNIKCIIACLLFIVSAGKDNISGKRAEANQRTPEHEA